jgi:hypothetical protein
MHPSLTIELTPNLPPIISDVTPSQPATPAEYPATPPQVKQLALVPDVPHGVRADVLTQARIPESLLGSANVVPGNSDPQRIAGLISRIYSEYAAADSRHTAISNAVTALNSLQTSASNGIASPDSLRGEMSGHGINDAPPASFVLAEAPGLDVSGTEYRSMADSTRHQALSEVSQLFSLGRHFMRALPLGDGNPAREAIVGSPFPKDARQHDEDDFVEVGDELIE